MRSSIIAAAFAAGALAAPYHKRDLVTDVQVDVVTAFVTVTAGHALPTPAAVEKLVSIPAPAPAPAPTSATTVVTFSQPQPQPQDSSSQDAQTSTDNSGSSAPSAPASGSYSDTVLYHHNVHRANHSASDLTWDQGLADIAATIGQSCVFAHDMGVNGATYGQNIASGPAPEDVGKVITDMFYNGEVNAFDGLYGVLDPTGDGFENWGHFSQLVWKATSTVGCATIDCSANGLQNGGGATWFTVCNYAQPGNVGSSDPSQSYPGNIGEPLGNPTITV